MMLVNDWLFTMECSPFLGQLNLENFVIRFCTGLLNSQVLEAHNRNIGSADQDHLLHLRERFAWISCAGGFEAVEVHSAGKV